MIAETGEGLATADTYVDPASAWAVAYMASTLYAEVWTAASTPQKEAAVISATRTLDAAYDWNGRRLTTVQALGFPRTALYIDGQAAAALPVQIKAATLEMALAMMQKNRLSDTATGEAAVKEIILGDGALELKFAEDPTINTPTDPANMIPPYVRQLLRGYGSFAGGTGMKRVVRR